MKNKKGQWGLLDLGGKRICSYKFDDLREMHEGRAAFFDAEARCWGFIDREGKEVIKARFGGAFDFQNGLALVATDEGDVYINREGDTVWPSKQADRKE